MTSPIYVIEMKKKHGSEKMISMPAISYLSGKWRCAAHRKVSSKPSTRYSDYRLVDVCDAPA
jgi:hypothetical protein